MIGREFISRVVDSWTFICLFVSLFRMKHFINENMYMWFSKLQIVYLEMTYEDQIRQLNTLGKDKLSEIEKTIA